MNVSDNFDFKALMECHPDNANNYSDLLRLMRRHVVIPFIGAGFSANFGYQTWSNFLKEQAKRYNLQEVKDALNTHEYEKAATALENSLAGGLEYLLMQTFGNHIYQESSTVELDCFPEIFPNLVLTTNFDEVIEMLYAKVTGENIDKVTPRSLQDVRLSHKRIACGEPTLIKLHGDVSSREFVLTEQSYDSVYGKRILDTRLPLPSFLRDILLSKVVLFLGCSLEDDRTLRVIEQSQIDGSISFALLKLPSRTQKPWEAGILKLGNEENTEYPELAKRRKFLNEHNIIPIWYPNGQYDALKVILRNIANQINPTASATRVCSRLKELFREGERLKVDGHTERAFSCYTAAAEIIKTNSEAFAEKVRLEYLRTIKSFYETNGYAFECKEIIKEIIELTKQKYSDKSPELALCYHEIGYTYERYQYYELMLKSMLKSQEILQAAKECKDAQSKEERKKHKAKILSASAYIYISTAYAFLKNNSDKEATEWYQKAEELLHIHGLQLTPKEKAFIYNGLHRYHQRLKKNYKEAVKTLEKAFRVRRQLYYSGDSSDLSDEKKRENLVHIFNTHSNKIRIFLEMKNIKGAKEEFGFCEEYPIWGSESYMRDTKCRILTDYGDILSKEGNAEDAYEQYVNALKYRRYLHFADDSKTAELYKKIAEALSKMPNRKDRLEEEMEYAVQACLLYEETMKSADIKQAQEDLRAHLAELSSLLSYSKGTLEQRLKTQREFLKYRHDDRLNNLEAELIKYFEL